MIAWFPVLKFAIALLLLWWAWRPIEKHMKAYRERERQALAGETTLTPEDTQFPTKKSAYLPLLIVIALILLSPFKLQGIQDAQHTLRTYDAAPKAEAPVIERQSRKQYTPRSDQPRLNDILKKEVTQ